MSEVSGLSSVKSTSSTSATEAEDDTTLVPTDKSWYKDYKLLDWGPRGLFVEYLEMGNFQFFLLPFFKVTNILNYGCDSQYLSDESSLSLKYSLFENFFRFSVFSKAAV